MTVGFFYTYLSILAFLAKPISGIIVDKFPVKKIMFITVVGLCGLSGFSLLFVQRLPTRSVANFDCDRIPLLNVCSSNDSRLAQCNENIYKRLRKNTKTVNCQVSLIVAMC